MINTTTVLGIPFSHIDTHTYELVLYLMYGWSGQNWRGQEKKFTNIIRVVQIKQKILMPLHFIGGNGGGLTTNADDDDDDEDTDNDWTYVKMTTVRNICWFFVLASVHLFVIKFLFQKQTNTTEDVSFELSNHWGKL